MPLIPQLSTWVHRPTVAFRVPEIFYQQVRAYAEDLDKGRATVIAAPVYTTVAEVDAAIAELQELRIKLKEKEKAERLAQSDRRLEAAIKFLAGVCDGAVERDGQGFAGCHTYQGNKLALTADIGWDAREAKVAYSIAQRYEKTQLQAQGLSLPVWEDIAEQYRESSVNNPKIVKFDNLPNGKGLRALYPFDRDINEALKPFGFEFDRDNRSWVCPKIKRPTELLAYLEQKEFDVLPTAYEFLLKAIEEEAAANLKALAVAEMKATHKEAVAKAAEDARVLRQRVLEAEQARALSILEEQLGGFDFGAAWADGGTPRDYQVAGAKWLISQNHKGIKGLKGGILADDMGVGKTNTALIAARFMSQTYGYAVLVVAPASVKIPWLRAAANVGVAVEVFSWGKLPKPLETRKYVVIADEAHYAQSGVESQRGAALLELCGHTNCEAAWMLSGTPMQNGRPKNLFPLLVATGAKKLTDKREYELRYCDLRHNGFSWDNTGATNLEELAEATKPFVLRRMKSEVLNLPGKQRVVVAAGLSNTAQASYNKALAEAVEEYRARALSGEVCPDAEALAMLTKARSLASTFKVPHTLQMADELLEQGQQVVIFTEFVEAANKLHEKLGGALLSSDLSSEARQKLVDDFQAGQHRVFITTIRCGGVGITLTAASTVVMHDRGWTPEGVDQAEDRCNRLGQTNTVLSYWVQLGQLDEICDRRIDEKAAIATAVLKEKGLKLPRNASVREIAETLFGRGKKSRS